MVHDHLLDLFIPVDPDKENALYGQHELNQISQFFAGSCSSSLVVIFLVRFWRVRLILTNATEILLHIPWRSPAAPTPGVPLQIMKQVYS
jgi:hypothetical protein